PQMNVQSDQQPAQVPSDAEAAQSTRNRWLPRHSIFFVALIAQLCVLFELLRVGMIWKNSASAAGATRGELLSSFFYGLRFDLSVACWVALPLVIVGHLPWFGLRHSHRLRKIMVGL